MNVACTICGNGTGNRRHNAREMMFGTRDPFVYLECADCGCVQIVDPPADLSPYYPAEYYSYRSSPRRRASALDAFLKRRRARAFLRGGDPLGSLVLALWGAPAHLRWLERLGIGFDDAILDVGCGAGELLRELQRDGFRRLAGLDPYVGGDLDLGGGTCVRRRGLGDEDGVYDLVMLHHALEHMSDQRGVFADLRRIVRPGGALLIRIPVADSEAWRRYGVDWVQLDAPRHLVLHTRRSLGLLAEAAGFAVEAAVCDGTAFQFWGSEQYLRDIPLRDPRSHAVDPRRSVFTTADLARFDEEARRLNATGEGDQAAFFLRRSPD